MKPTSESKDGYSPVKEKSADLSLPHTQRKLQARHLTMIAIGGTIGTGLFVATGASLSNAGPGGALVAYMTVGIMVYFVVSSLGEMATLIPISGSFNTYASRFFDEALGFTMGWNYWFSWAISLPTEITAMTFIMNFWFPDIPSWIWCLLFLVLLFSINLIGVEGFGETEYWFSMIKVIAVVVFIILGLTIAFVGLPGHDAIGFTNYTIPGSPFVNGILGMFTVYTTAFFSYGGTELVGITAGEAINPRKSVPKAINGTFWRITIFYALSIFVLGLLIPYNDPNLALFSGSHDGSLTPFTLAFERAGITFAAHMMNVVILIAALSAGNSSLYATSRTMMALAEEGKAPKFFAYKSSWGVPLVSLCFSASFGLIPFLGCFISLKTIFNWLTNITGMSSLVTWIFICIIHIRFRRAYVLQGYDVSKLPYRSPFFPFGQYLSIFMGVLVLIGEGYSVIAGSDQVDWVQILGVYLGVPFYILLYVIYKIVRKTRVIRLEDCDFVTGASIEEDDEDEIMIDEEEYAGEMVDGLKKVVHFLV